MQGGLVFVPVCNIVGSSPVEEKLGFCSEALPVQDEQEDSSEQGGSLSGCDELGR